MFLHYLLHYYYSDTIVVTYLLQSFSFSYCKFLEFDITTKKIILIITVLNILLPNLFFLAQIIYFEKM